MDRNNIRIVNSQQAKDILIFNIIKDKLYKTNTGLNNIKIELDIYEFVHSDTIMKVTNKMQLYRLLYYS